VQFFIRDDEKAIHRVIGKESHPALISSTPPSELFSEDVAESQFRVCAGKQVSMQDSLQGLRLMENLIPAGPALGWLPNYFIAGTDLVPIEVSGCPCV
jgi:hypothetical protein